MNRLDIIYGGKPYSIGGRSLESFQDEIAEAAKSSNPYWLKVNTGEGRLEDAYLYMAPGIPIAVVDVQAAAAPTTDSVGDIDHDDTFVLDVL